MVEFDSDDFPSYPGEEEEINPGIWGKRLAEYLVAKLPEHGVIPGEFYNEDWGVEIPIENDAFPMFIGCSNQSDPGGTRSLCFIDPSKPTIRKGFFKKMSTVADIERVANALDKVLKGHPGIRHVVWSDADNP
jgi:hypothetical protein